MMVVLIAAAVALTLAAVPSLAQAAPILDELTDPAERARVESMIEAARQEGRLVMYSNTLSTGAFDAVAEAFRAKYGLHDLDISFSHIKSPDLELRVDEQLRSGNVSVDLTYIGAMEWMYSLLDNGEIMHYESPGYEHYGPAKALGMVEDGYWVSDIYVFTIGYNTALVNKEIKDWHDLLDPRFQGQIVVGDVGRVATYAIDYIGLRKVLDRSFFEQLADLRPMAVISNDEIASLAASGERPITTTVFSRPAGSLMDLGAPLKLVYPESGAVGIPLPLAILQRAPHPNAAKLFVDFMRSEEAQAIIVATDRLISGRAGVASPEPELVPPVEQLNLIPMDYRNDLTQENIDRAREEWRSLFER